MYADPCRFYRNNRRQVHVIVGNTSYNCNCISASFVRAAVGSIKVTIRSKEPLMKFQMCLLSHGYIYVQVFQLFTELITLPPNVIRIKCYDFEWPMNSSGQYFSLSNTTSLDSVKIRCTAVTTTFNILSRCKLFIFVFRTDLPVCCRCSGAGKLCFFATDRLSTGTWSA
jgi:hypothetical protein